MKDLKEMKYDELLELKKNLEHYISQRSIHSCNISSKIVQIGDEVEIQPDYGGEIKKGIVKELLGNKLYIPNLNHITFGSTPYYSGILKIFRKGKEIFNRNTIGLNKIFHN